MAGARTLMVATANAAAALIFIIAGMVRWIYCIPMLIGAIVGGYLGARLGQILPPLAIRIWTLLITAVTTRWCSSGAPTPETRSQHRELVGRKQAQIPMDLGRREVAHQRQPRYFAGRRRHQFQFDRGGGRRRVVREGLGRGRTANHHGEVARRDVGGVVLQGREQYLRAGT